jgi:two-component system cell cycle response regulator
MSSKPKPQLLLVEDNASTQAALTRLFRTQFEVTATDSPIKALEFIKNGLTPTIIFSDYIMPEMSGLEFLTQAKSLSPASMRIILTGHLATDQLTKAVQENILHRVLLKPWENDLLLFQMQEVVKQQEDLFERVRLEKLAITDSVTGLYNHRYFLDCLQKEVERAHRHSRPLSLILVDVDSFKDVNDSKGHLHGDEILQIVAQQLKEGVRNIDSACRYGGDEFAIILPDTTVEGAREVAERIRLAVTSKTDEVSLSLGVAELPPDLQQARPFIEMADQALYQAKRNGKNQTVVADPKNIK